MEFSEWFILTEGVRQLTLDFMKTPAISLIEAKRRKMFGPVHHGTTEENRQRIGDTGFEVYVGAEKSGNTSHGYTAFDYSKKIPAPIHHLGYGIYFTTKVSIGKDYNQGTKKGLVDYYLDVPRLATINFASPNTMMKWWQQNGYDMKPVDNFSNPDISDARIQATVNLTNHLKASYDAVWFKGKGFRGSLLDGDQIVVFDVNRIYKHDPSADRQESGIGVGDRIKVKNVPTIGKVVNIQSIEQSVNQDRIQLVESLFGKSRYILSLKNIVNYDAFFKYYVPIFKEKMLNIPRLSELLSTRMKNDPVKNSSLEVAKELLATRLAEQLLDPAGYPSLPDVLVDQVYPKGSRIKI